MDYKKEFINLLQGKVGNKKIDENTDLRGLGIDSLDLVEIIMAAEEKFGIQFTNEELNGFQTVKDVLAAIESKK